jgi:hypothetical protein
MEEEERRASNLSETEGLRGKGEPRELLRVLAGLCVGDVKGREIGEGEVGREGCFIAERRDCALSAIFDLSLAVAALPHFSYLCPLSLG